MEMLMFCRSFSSSIQVHAETTSCWENRAIHPTSPARFAGPCPQRRCGADRAEEILPPFILIGIGGEMEGFRQSGTVDEGMAAFFSTIRRDLAQRCLLRAKEAIRCPICGSWVQGTPVFAVVLLADGIQPQVQAHLLLRKPADQAGP